MKTILIVCADSHIQKALQKLVQTLLTELRSIGPAKVLSTDSMDEAIYLIGEREVDLLMIDHQLPGMDAFRLIESIDNAPIEMAKVLIVKDKPTVANLVRIAELGIDEIMIRPLRRDDLKRILQMLIAR